MGVPPCKACASPCAIILQRLRCVRCTQVSIVVMRFRWTEGEEGSGGCAQVLLEDAELLTAWQRRQAEYKARRKLTGKREADVLSQLSAFTSKVPRLSMGIPGCCGSDAVMEWRQRMRRQWQHQRRERACLGYETLSCMPAWLSRAVPLSVHSLLTRAAA